MFFDPSGIYKLPCLRYSRLLDGSRTAVHQRPRVLLLQSGHGNRGSTYLRNMRNAALYRSEAA